MRNRAGRTAPAIIGLILFTGCNDGELQSLKDENDRLKAELGRKPLAPELSQIEEFTVGLAAAEKGFDENAFLRHLRTSLQDSNMGGTGKFSIAGESDEGEIAKLRNLLVQQYLEAKKVPIRISNLAYKLKDPKGDFKIGGAVVPRGENLAVEKSGDGLSRFTCKETLIGHMDREGPEKFSVPYEDSEGGRGTIPVVIRDVDVLNAAQPVQVARQGDVSFNWQFSLEKVYAYRVSNYSGDVGSFMRKMRYPEAGLNQYQTVRDSIFLFGYGPYPTSLVNRIETPRFIDRVDVVTIGKEVYDRLEPGISEENLAEGLKGAGQGWTNCNFVEFTADKKIWERPVSVGFPFLSRQVSEEKKVIFFTKYDQRGPILIGDFPLKSAR